MRKKIFIFALCLVLIMINCIYAFASNDSFTSGGFSTDKQYSSVNELWTYVCTKKSVTNSGYIARYADIGGRYGLQFFLFDSDCILIRNENSDTSYNWFVYKYDGEKMVQHYFYGSTTYDTSLVYLSCYDDDVSYCTTSKNYGISWDNTTGAYEISDGMPIATSVENALLYYQTMDYSYLENASEFLDKPEPPSNVSFYQASDENSIWVYWENYKFYTAENVTAKTCYDYSYFYKNASDEEILLDGPYSNSKDYVDRYQVGLSYLPILNYDNGFMVIRLWNEVNYNGVVKSSDIVSLLYYPNLNYVSKIIFDVDTQEQLSETVSKSVVDYKTYNESFTGGNITLSDIPTASDGDFSLLSGLSSGFGLLGNTGLLGLMASLFTYLPEKIIELIVYGVKAVIAIALFKFLIH